MSFEGGVENLKPEAKIVEPLDFVGKCKNDIELLKDAKRRIESIIEEKKLTPDEHTTSQLNRLDKSIKKLEKLVENWEKKNG